MDVFCNEACNVGTRDKADPGASGKSVEIDEAEPPGGQRPWIALQDAAMPRMGPLRPRKNSSENSPDGVFVSSFPWLPRISEWLPVANSCSTSPRSPPPVLPNSLTSSTLASGLSGSWRTGRSPVNTAVPTNGQVALVCTIWFLTPTLFATAVMNLSSLMKNGHACGSITNVLSRPRCGEPIGRRLRWYRTGARRFVPGSQHESARKHASA